MEPIKWTDAERHFFRNTTEDNARQIWKSHTGRTISRRHSAITWCVGMGFLTMKA